MEMKKRLGGKLNERGQRKMIEYIGLAIIVILALFFLEWFGIIDVPFLEIKDFTAGKKEMLEKTIESIEKNGVGKW